MAPAAIYRECEPGNDGSKGVWKCRASATQLSLVWLTFSGAKSSGEYETIFWMFFISELSAYGTIKCFLIFSYGGGESFKVWYTRETINNCPGVDVHLVNLRANWRPFSWGRREVNSHGNHLWNGHAMCGRSHVGGLDDETWRSKKEVTTPGLQSKRVATSSDY